MRWVYIGTGLFATSVLEKLYLSGLRPGLVVVPPDKRRGRGLKRRPVPVKEFAIEANIDYVECENLEEENCKKRLIDFNPDFLVVCDYGKILKREILAIPRIAPLNIHPSLLPKYRGAAPIERSILNGEKETGISIIIMNERIDAGELLLQEKVAIGEDETKGDLIVKLSVLVPELLKQAMEGLIKAEIRPHPQTGASSYAKKIKKEELFIDWNEDAVKVKNKINAFSPIPGARSELNNEIIKILRARLSNKALSLSPGEIYVEHHTRLFVGTGKGVVEILEIQPPGKKIMLAKEFIQGRKLDGLSFS